MTSQDKNPDEKAGGDGSVANAEHHGVQHTPLARASNASNNSTSSPSASPLRLGVSRPSGPELSSQVAMSRRNSQTSLRLTASAASDPSFPAIQPRSAATPVVSNLPLPSRPASIVSRNSTLSNAATEPIPSVFSPTGSETAPGLLSPPKGRATAQLLRAQSQTGSIRKSGGRESTPDRAESDPPPSGLSAKAKGKQREDLTYTARQRERGVGAVRTISGVKGSTGNAKDGTGQGAPRSSIHASVATPDWPPEQSIQKFPPRRYFVLTNAGKPVFCSRAAESDDEQLTNMMGVAQAIVSIYAEDDDKIRSIESGSLRVVFLLRPPLYLFCTSDWGEPEFVLRNHLEYLYLQMLSVVTGGQLTKVFQKRSNFDLRRLLEGTDGFCHSLIANLQSEFSYMTSTLQPLRMSGAIRDAAATALIPPAKMQDLLYVLLIAGGQIVTLLRPRKHSIHPTDLHLLLNIIQASPALRKSDTWLPICLPKFNSDGFVYAFVSYLREDVGMIFLSADREGFEVLQDWKAAVAENLARDGLLDRIEDAIGVSPYSISDIGVPGLRHFFYKSRKNVQITTPTWEGPYAVDGPTRWSLMTLYQTVYDAIHARSGQGAPLKQFFIKTDDEACMGWITQPFELYLTVSPDMPRSAVVSAANAIVKWVNKQETRLFLREAPVF